MDKRRIIMNSYFSSQLSCYPLVWMFHSRTTNNKIIRLHKRCFRVIYNDKTSSFENLLEKGRSLGPKIWNIVTSKLKELKSISDFKKVMKQCWPENCPCRL